MDERDRGQWHGAWYHFVGAEEGLGAYKRWHEPGRAYFEWLAKHDDELSNKGTLADIAVVMGQRNQRFYLHPEFGDPMMNIHGLYMALLEGRFLFDFLHEEDLLTDKLKKYKTLLLPNIALLSTASALPSSVSVPTAAPSWRRLRPASTTIRT